MAPDGAERRAIRTLLRDFAPQDRGVSRPHARALPRDGPPGGAALPAAAPGGAPHRAAERPRQAHQRAPLRLRGPAAADARRDLGQVPARLAGPARRAVRRRPRHRPAKDSDASSMDLSLDSPWKRLWLVFSLVRYRFFLYAALLPYLLGAAWGYAIEGAFDAAVFWSGLGGVVLAVVGVESFNEYFDSRMGTDRVFNPEDLPPMSVLVLWLGIAAFAGALAVGIYLTWRGGWPILAFALLGGLAAIFYVAPPLPWASRGSREAGIPPSYRACAGLGTRY